MDEETTRIEYFGGPKDGLTYEIKPLGGTPPNVFFHVDGEKGLNIYVYAGIRMDESGFPDVCLYVFNGLRSPLNGERIKVQDGDS